MAIGERLGVLSGWVPGNSQPPRGCPDGVHHRANGWTMMDGGRARRKKEEEEDHSSLFIIHHHHHHLIY